MGSLGIYIFHGMKQNKDVVWKVRNVAQPDSKNVL